MKNIKYLISLIVMSLFIFGCDVQTPSQDPEPIGSTDAYPTPTFTLSSGMLKGLLTSTGDFGVLK